ncbi:MAG: hypothetical protein CML99_00340 [Rhodobiaceae bacterium]|nr:hypothetical protein [Rhodobiaceae bacterium]|tara:strand:+ start:63 stop:443 length:381 start_codon:yes stop_codon:yes gene_type:complete
MQDLPTANELISVVSEFLREQLLPELEGRKKFHTLVAANALDIVARELDTAPKANIEERHRLANLLGAEGSLAELNKTFCQALRSGKLDLETEGVKEHLWATTLAKLSVDQPKYSAFRKAQREGRI